MGVLLMKNEKNVDDLEFLIKLTVSKVELEFN